MAKRLTNGQREELRWFFSVYRGLRFAHIKAQSYEPQTSGGESQLEERMLRSAGFLNPFSIAVVRVQRVLEYLALTESGAKAAETLRLAYSPAAERDIHGGSYPQEISALLRLTDRVIMVAGGRWCERERARLTEAFIESCRLRGLGVVQAETVTREIARGGKVKATHEQRPRLFSMTVAGMLLAFDEELVVVPPDDQALERDANEVLREGADDVLFGDELVPGALDQARAWLQAAETAYATACKATKDGAQVPSLPAVELPRRHPVEMDPSRQRRRERQAKEG